MTQKEIKINPIGEVKVDESKGIYSVIINKEFRPALKEVENFTHINLIWWAHKSDSPALRKKLIAKELPPFYGDKAPAMGIFATRSEYRPNPIAITTLQILSLDKNEGLITFPYLDAMHGTPIIDIKPYLPMSDLIQSADYPEYLQHWPKNYEDAVEWFTEIMNDQE